MVVTSDARLSSFYGMYTKAIVPAVLRTFAAQARLRNRHGGWIVAIEHRHVGMQCCRKSHGMKNLNNVERAETVLPVHKRTDYRNQNRSSYPKTILLTNKMHFSNTIFALAASSAYLATAFPTMQQNLTNFYLVTTTYRDAVSNSSALPDVNATSLFDADSPSSSNDLYQLRLIAAGYGSVPQFNLTDNVLHTIAYGAHGLGKYDYESTEVEGGQVLEFDFTAEGGGDLSLKNGYLLAVNGQCTGWTVCLGAHDEAVVSRCLVVAVMWCADFGLCRSRGKETTRVARLGSFRL